VHDRNSFSNSMCIRVARESTNEITPLTVGAQGCWCMHALQAKAHTVSHPLTSFPALLAVTLPQHAYIYELCWGHGSQLPKHAPSRQQCEVTAPARLVAALVLAEPFSRSSCCASSCRSSLSLFCVSASF
jgi:hypothetical protein